MNKLSARFGRPLTLSLVAALASASWMFGVGCGGSDTGSGGSGGSGNTTTGSGVTGTGGSSTTGTGGASACTPGEAKACYSGPAATENVGICKGGMQTCQADGKAFGACMGETIPGTEDCDAAMTDEDCDGKVNEEGSSCKCGDTYLSNAEQCDDGNTAANDGCDGMCKIEAVTQMSVGNGTVCAVLYDGRLKCWGENNFGQLGIETTQIHGDNPNEMEMNLPAVNLGPGRTVLSVAVGTIHVCALLDDHSVKCWGQNQNGQLGQGDGFLRGDFPGQMGANLLPVKLGTGRTATAISAGGLHSCALLDDASVKCWGENGSGILGDGDVVQRGKLPTDMGDALPAIKFGVGLTAKAISTGFSSSCAILSNDKVKCWGVNTFGELGLGDTGVRGATAAQMGDNLPFVDLGTNRTAKQIGVGISLACALLDDASVKCWGNGFYGQLGQGDNTNRGDAMGEMGDALPAINLGTGRTALSIAVGGSHVCARLDDGTMKCWGRSLFGGLGYGDVASRGDAMGEMGDTLPAVDLGTSIAPGFIAAGSTVSCAVATTGHLKCWGGNDKGQLGQGDVNPRGDAMGEMGDALPFVKLLSPTW